MLDRFSKIHSNKKLQENPSSGSKVVPCGWTDRHDKANSRFSQFCEYTYKKVCSHSPWPTHYIDPYENRMNLFLYSKYWYRIIVFHEPSSRMETDINARCIFIKLFMQITCTSWCLHFLSLNVDCTMKF